ncbi:hypothetical protein [uncultured Lacinutrix sp.]|uniref:hypothetical protein n=1 Tax=uncultured Lacinutrix sp. TaxID=574032 RepID=UPI002613B69C|nr:hypothetical protein [uncultured Lacinutrix sp.]
MNNRLKELKKRKEALSYILDANFETLEEFNAFKIEKSDDFNELKEINNEIRDIEWQLMSSTEQQDLLDYYDKIKEKYSK